MDKVGPGDDVVPSSPPLDEEADPELARLPPSRPRRSPILAAAVIAVAGLLLFHLRADLVFALSSSSPVELGDAARLAGPGASAAALAEHANRYVAIGGMPDYRDALLFEPKGDRYRRAFFPLLGTEAHVVVRAEETQTRGALTERFVGRLERFADVPWAEQVRAYYAGKVASSRLLDLPALHQRLLQSGKPLADTLGDAQHPVADIGGEAVHLTPDSAMEVVVDYPDELRVTLPADKFAVEEDARHELERLLATPGLLGPPQLVGPAIAAPASDEKQPPAAAKAGDGYAYFVRTSRAGRDGLLELLDKHDVRFALHQERATATPRELAAAGDDLSLRGRPIAWSRVLSIHVAAPVTIPPDAFILVEGDAPGAYLWAPIVAGLLVLFLLFNVWMLLRSLGAPRPAPLDPARPDGLDRSNGDTAS